MISDHGLPQIDYLIFRDRLPADFERLLNINYRKYRCWLEEDNQGIKKINEEYIQSKRKQVIEGMYHGDEPRVLDDLYNTEKECQIKVENISSNQRMRRYLKKVVKRIHIILKASKFFKIPLKDNSIDLSIFMDKYTEEERLKNIHAGTYTSKELIESLINYLNYGLMFDNQQFSKLQQSC